jgi:putative RNA 2'-phosphotransferase
VSIRIKAALSLPDSPKTSSSMDMRLESITVLQVWHRVLRLSQNTMVIRLEKPDNTDMENNRVVQISKTMSKALRHKPQSLGLQLSLSGWVSVDALLEAFNRKGFSLTRAELEEVVALNDKQRFAFDETKQNIRASQGHSVPVELGLVALEPPEFLFHGTTTQSVEAILKTGLEKMRRHHVHLSADTQTALRVGSRHGQAVILKIFALELHRAGHEFFCSQNGVWLAEAVPPQFLEVL